MRRGRVMTDCFSAERDGDMMQYLVILLKGQVFLSRIG